MAKSVKLKFDGYKSDVVAQKFYTWVVDGGLEDGIIDNLSDDDISVEGITNIDNEILEITVTSKKACN